MNLPDAICCAAAFALAMAIGIAATQAGPGLTADSATYLSMATNLREGLGFVTSIVGPLDPLPFAPVTIFPPGYSLLIAGLMGVGLPAIQAARFVSLLSFAGLGVAIYWLGHLLGGRPAAVLACATTLVLPPVVKLATFALSDTTFAFLSVVSLLALVKYNAPRHQHRLKWLLVAGFVISLTIWVRYYGMLWVLLGVSSILLSRGVSIARKSEWMLYFSMASLLPVAPVFARNVVLTGQLSGVPRDQGYHVSFFENIKLLLTTLDSDLAFHFNAGIVASLSPVIHAVPLKLILAVGLLLLLLLAVLWTTRFRFRPWTTTRSIGMNSLSQHVLIRANLLIGACSYVIGLVILSANILFLPSDWSRYVTPIYPIVGVIWADVWLRAVGRVQSWRPQSIGAVAALLLAVAVWIAPYAAETRFLVAEASHGFSWTLTAEKWRSNAGIMYLLDKLSPTDVVYSDSPYAVSVLLGRPARDVPASNDQREIAAWLDQPRAPGVAEYVIVFKNNLAGHPPYWPMPVLDEDLASLALARTDVHLIADLPDSAIYRLSDTAGDSVAAQG